MVVLSLIALTSGNLTFPDGGLPMSRPFAYAVSGGKELVGGLDGLFVGKSGDWVRADVASVKQIDTDSSGAAWVRYGDGAVDKVDVKSGRHWHDVLFGSSRRPWVSTIGFAGSTVLFGGHGGWMESGPGQELIDFYPAELKGQVVTAVYGRGKDRFIGTQGSGLWQFSGTRAKQFGLAAGLDDPWVTGLCHDGRQLWIGTADDGVYSLASGKLSRLAAPFRRVRGLALWGKRVAVATDIGAFVWDREWRRVSEKECYSVTPGVKLAVVEPDAIRFMK